MSTAIEEQRARVLQALNIAFNLGTIYGKDGDRARIDEHNQMARRTLDALDCPPAPGEVTDETPLQQLAFEIEKVNAHGWEWLIETNRDRLKTDFHAMVMPWGSDGYHGYGATPVAALQAALEAAAAPEQK